MCAQDSVHKGHRAAALPAGEGSKFLELTAATDLARNPSQWLQFMTAVESSTVLTKWKAGQRRATEGTEFNSYKTKPE